MIDAAAVGLLPLPLEVQQSGATSNLRPGRFVLSQDSLSSDRIERALGRLNTQLQPGQADSATATLCLQTQTEHGPSAAPQFGDAEDYRLRVEADGVTLTGASEWGLLHGIESLAQLLAADGGLPCCEVNDAPRFPWRGLLLDVARHFLSLETLKRTLDCMASVKLNVLHLHLTDDQGFRFHSERYPKLASAEAYSATELAELVAFAADRGIRIVPELDMPGHVTSWLCAYPEWGMEAVAASVRFGVHRAGLNPAEPAVYDAIDALVTELAAIFPDRYLHIGGDEVHPDCWAESVAVAQYKAAHGLSDNAALQAHFSRRVQALLRSHGRSMVVWDEALHPDLAQLEPAVVVQNWRGATTRDRALAAGHPCIVSSGYYLDLHFPADWHYLFDPEAEQAQLLEHEDALLAHPAFANVAQGMRWTHQWREGAMTQAPGPDVPVLGGEACLWGELVDDATVDLRLWTRLPAIAERLWSSASARDCEDLYTRMQRLQEHWQLTGRNDLQARQAQGLLAAGINPTWQQLLAWFEPVKWYGRLLGARALQARLQGKEMPKARPYDVHTPLSRPIDHLPVESLASRRLATAMEREQQPATLAAIDSWRELLAAADCPTALQVQRGMLAELLRLVQKRSDGGRLTTQESQILTNLQQPVDDMLLVPALTLADWLVAEAT